MECALYGHKKVVPASGVPGNCYVLTEVEGVVPGGLNTQLNQQEEEEEEVEVTGEVEYHQVNIRVSSSPCLTTTQSDCAASVLRLMDFQWLGWAWAVPRPGLDIQAVARHPARSGRPGLRPRLRRPQPLHSLRPGGHRVRAVRPQAGQQGKMETLIVHCLCQVAPASGVPGDCYLLGKGEEVKLEEEEEEEETDDGGEIEI